MGFFSIAGQFGRSLAALSKLRRLGQLFGVSEESTAAAALLPTAAREVPQLPTLPDRHLYGSRLRAIVQGLDRPLGRQCAARMRAHGTPAIAGIAPGAAGSRSEELSVFDLVERARAEFGTPDASLIATEPFGVLDAGYEALAAGIRQLIVLTPGVPPLDMMQLLGKAETLNARVLGAGSSGIFVPGQLLLGNYNADFYRPGRVGLISSVGCLTDDVALALGSVGQSLVVSLGTEEILASSYEPWLELLDKDTATEAIVLVARADCSVLEAAADHIAADCNKPVVAYLVGRSLPPAPKDCSQALEEAGARLVGRPSQILSALGL